MPLSIEEFGTHLLDSGDLDPVYVALHALQLPKRQLERWLLAYWCWYDCGVASYLSEREGKQFWTVMRSAALNETTAPSGGRWLRGRERRHARGAQAVRMVDELAQRHGAPENFAAHLDIDRKWTCREVMDYAGANYLFGPWISFKVADMAERCLGSAVSFDEASTFMFRDPTEAALMLWRERTRQPPNALPKSKDHVIREVVGYLEGQFGHRAAPPRDDRPVGLQEVETILCKWKSHVHGKYPPFHDQHDILAAIPPWAATCETAARFQRAVPGWSG